MEKAYCSLVSSPPPQLSLLVVGITSSTIALVEDWQQSWAYPCFQASLPPPLRSPSPPLPLPSKFLITCSVHILEAEKAWERDQRSWNLSCAVMYMHLCVLWISEVLLGTFTKHCLSVCMQGVPRKCHLHFLPCLPLQRTNIGLKAFCVGLCYCNHVTSVLIFYWLCHVHC